ncbi:hypothetical protein MBLNU457_7018t1 [Dothideomycetes sp. NU457]
MSHTTSGASASLSHASRHSAPHNHATSQDASSSSASDSASNTAAPRRPASPPLAAQATPQAGMPVPGQLHPSNQTALGSSSSSSASSSSGQAFSAATSEPATPSKIKIKDLAHITALATSDSKNELGGNRSRESGPQYEISDMPIENIIEMVAGLLTKITTTNDMQHEHLHRQVPSADGNSSITAQTSSVLAFHGKNVPSITILSYLNRINKYCPTSYEVFLSLLVYFDRMTEKVNSGPIQSLREANERTSSVREQGEGTEPPTPMEDFQESDILQTATPPLSSELQKQPQHFGAVPGTPHSRSFGPESPAVQGQQGHSGELNLSHFFVVDSFNIHRLVIAGVTCASKFFSDIFYTNSRYAKVGGLPLPELNHLELQFLLLNDFRLSVPVDELQAYGTMLVEFYAREVLAQQGTESGPSTSE